LIIAENPRENVLIVVARAANDTRRQLRDYECPQARKQPAGNVLAGRRTLGQNDGLSLSLFRGRAIS
jgi:hypothetical protein